MLSPLQLPQLRRIATPPPHHATQARQQARRAPVIMVTGEMGGSADLMGGSVDPSEGGNPAEQQDAHLQFDQVRFWTETACS